MAGGRGKIEHDPLCDSADLRYSVSMGLVTHSAYRRTAAKAVHAKAPVFSGAPTDYRQSCVRPSLFVTAPQRDGVADTGRCGVVLKEVRRGR